MLGFLLLTGFAIGICAAIAFVFFWPMALVHLRDRHSDLLDRFGAFAFGQPAALYWLLLGRYRALRDPSLSGLCTPARLALWTIIATLPCAALVIYMQFVCGSGNCL